MKNMLYTSVILILLTLVADNSYGLDIMHLRDQSRLRCQGGIPECLDIR
jgi:hypothetical protein